MRGRRKRACRVLFGIVIAGVAAVLLGCSPGSPQRVTIGLPALEQNALLYVASSKGMFTANGLDVAFKNYDSGASAMDGMLRGEVEVGQAAEYPAVRAAFQKDAFSLIACNDKFENEYIVAREDRKIAAIADLKNKRIGVARGTIAEFYLGRFLSLNQMSLADVTLIDVSPGRFVEAFQSGEVDAVAAWQPYVGQMEKKVASRAWPAQSSQLAYGILACRKQWIQGHGEAVRRLLKSLLAAEEYLDSHQEEAKTIVRKALGYEASYVEEAWPRHEFGLFLDQTLIVALEDEAQWMIANALTKEKEVPNFLDYLDRADLSTVKPEAVKIIQ